MTNAYRYMHENFIVLTMIALVSYEHIYYEVTVSNVTIYGKIVLDL